jgi:hypothetical protein
MPAAHIVQPKVPKPPRRSAGAANRSRAVKTRVDWRLSACFQLSSMILGVVFPSRFISLRHRASSNANWRGVTCAGDGAGGGVNGVGRGGVTSVRDCRPGVGPRAGGPGRAAAVDAARRLRGRASPRRGPSSREAAAACPPPHFPPKPSFRPTSFRYTCT